MGLRPPSLGEVLEAGAELALSELWLDRLLHQLWLELPFLPPVERARRARLYRAEVEDLIAHGERSQYVPAWGDGSEGFIGTGTFEQYVMLEHWTAEIYEEPGLAARLREALPTHLIASYQSKFDQYRRPHPIDVRVPEGWWQCQSCGASFDEGEQEAVLVTAQEGHSDLDYEITYCGGCVGIAARLTTDLEQA